MKHLRLTAFLILSMGAWAIARAQDYKCKVERITGAMEQDVRSTSGDLLGQEFSVDRISGLMFGPSGLKNSYHANTQPKIVDSGTKENSFIVVTTRTPHPAGWTVLRTGRSKVD